MNIWTPSRIIYQINFSVCLDTVYFAKNLLLKTIKKIISGLLFTAENTIQHCSFALMHCSWDMNSARGASQIKKKKKKGKTQTPKRDPNRALIKLVNLLNIIYMIITSLIKNFKCIEGKHLSGIHLGPILWFLHRANLLWWTLEK